MIPLILHPPFRKLSSSRTSARLLCATLGLVLAACAAKPTAMTEEKSTVEKSRIYTDGVDVLPASHREARGLPCAVPPGLKGANTGHGESKIWKELLGRANSCVNDANWTTLETLANEMAKADIGSPWPAYFLGLAADVRGDFSRAMWMTELAQKKSSDPVALFTYQRGRIFLHMHDINSALADLQTAVEMQPGLFDAQLYLAEIYQRDQDLDQAKGYYRAALKANAESYAALVGLAEIMLAQNSPGESADLYTRAANVDAKQIDPWIRLAFIYESVQKNPDLALVAYQNVRSRLASGGTRGKIDYDVNARIKIIEDGIRARQPATQGAGAPITGDATHGGPSPAKGSTSNGPASPDKGSVK